MKRTHWKKGLDITPEILIASDNFHITERQLLGRILAAHTYGILPENNFSVETDLHNNRLLIRNLKCTALTKAGYLINIQSNNTFKKELQLNESINEQCYVVLAKNAEVVEENELDVYSDYTLTLQSINEPVNNAIPVLKIGLKQGQWELDRDFIPPAISIHAVSSLQHLFQEMKTTISKIIGKIPEKDALNMQVKILQIELNGFSLEDSPKALALLIKKFCLLFQSFLISVNKPEAWQVAKHFIELPYNHDEMSLTLHEGYGIMAKIYQILEQEPVAPVEIVPEIEEINV